MQSGLGMAPWQSGNSFVALGVAYFLSALYAPKLIARHSMGKILLAGGLAVQISGLLLLMETFHHYGQATGALTLAPSTALIGYGQALIVNCFYRVGMRDITAIVRGGQRPAQRTATGDAGSRPGGVWLTAAGSDARSPAATRRP